MKSFRAVVVVVPEPDDNAHQFLVTFIETTLVPPDERFAMPTLIDGPVIESFYTEDAGRAIESARECEDYTLEERLALQFEREQLDRYA